MTHFRRAAVWTTSMVLALTPLSAVAQVADSAGSSPTDLLALWDTARGGDFSTLNRALQGFDKPGVNADSIAGAAGILSHHIAQREKDRASRLETLKTELDKALAMKPITDISTSKALRAVIETHMLSLDKEGVLQDDRTKSLIARAENAAKAAEGRGDIIAAGELFVLLDALFDVSGQYKDDVRRIVQRQEMLRMYVPEQLYNQRIARARAMGEEDFPPYNAFGDDYHVKTKGIDETLILRAIARTRQHIEQRPINLLLTGGLEAVRTMITTQDLASAFPYLAVDARRQHMLDFLENELSSLRARAARPGGGQMDQVQVENLLDRLVDADQESVEIPKAALLHEFGNGLMSKLDEFSAIIWPDEVQRFAKSTEGQFVGIGVQIEYDELLNIRVITPLEGTPAQRAGIHPKDVIKEVDGHPMLGLSLDQAVEVITGPEGTPVRLTLERPLDDSPDAAAPSPDAKSDLEPTEVKPEGEDPEVTRKAAIARAKAMKKELVEVTVKRGIIKVSSVKGWKREGIREDSWNWFIDRDNGIGYVRLLQFSDQSAAELDRAIAEMKKEGLNGLIFDLRYNPGGLLDQAVKISRSFIKEPNAPIVMTQGPNGMIDNPEVSQPSKASLGKLPIVVLINETSASASEIVSGALSVYAHRGELDAVILGSRSYGKGSVQNVWPLAANARMKVTTAYYMLPDKSIIHRRPGAKTWGIQPDLAVEMLPKQTEKALNIRRNSDVRPLNEKGEIAMQGDTPNPDDLIDKGIDLQLETALVLLRAKVTALAAAR